MLSHTHDRCSGQCSMDDDSESALATFNQPLTDGWARNSSFSRAMGAGADGEEGEVEAGEVEAGDAMALTSEKANDSR